MVVIEKCRLTCISTRRIYTILGSFFNKHRYSFFIITCIYKKLFGPVFICSKTRIAYIYIEQAIAIYVYHIGACFPGGLACYTGSSRCIFKMKIAFIDKKFG